MLRCISDVMTVTNEINLIGLRHRALRPMKNYRARPVRTLMVDASIKIAYSKTLGTMRNDPAASVSALANAVTSFFKCAFNTAPGKSFESHVTTFELNMTGLPRRITAKKQIEHKLY